MTFNIEWEILSIRRTVPLNSGIPRIFTGFEKKKLSRMSAILTSSLSISSSTLPSFLTLSLCSTNVVFPSDLILS